MMDWKQMLSNGAAPWGPAEHWRSIGNAFRITLLTGLAAMAAVNAGQWEIGTVDGAMGGRFSSLQFDKFGNAHVAYEAEGALQYSFWDHHLQKWFTMTLDKATGFCSLTLDSKQHPHISYPQFGELKYTYWDGSSWQKRNVPLPSKDTTFYTSIALDAKDNPSITYYENFLPTGENIIRLRMVSRTDKVWELMTVDQQRGSGKFNSLAMDSAGRPHIAYGNVQYENAGLRYAYWDGTRWRNEIIEGAGVPGTYRQAVMLILDKHDIPHIAYSDALNQIVKYATRLNGKWQTQAVDAIGAVAFPDRNGIALDEEGTPYISYFDGKNGILKVAHRKEQKWVSEVVDSGFAGFTSSLQIHEGTIWLTYSGAPGEGLRFARRSLTPAAPTTQSQARSISK